MKRLAVAPLAGVAALVLLALNATPASAGLIGPKLPVESSYALTGACGSWCTVLQVRPGMFKVPSNGTLTRFRIQYGWGKFRLEVLRRRQGTRFHALASSRMKTFRVRGSDPYHDVASRQVHMRVHRGDWLALQYDDGYLQTGYATSYLPGARMWGFNHLRAGMTAMPTHYGLLSDYVLLFNATFKR